MMYMHNAEEKSWRTTIVFPANLKIKLRMMCVLTNRQMSQFVRIAVQEKINQIRKETGMNEFKWDE